MMMMMMMFMMMMMLFMMTTTTTMMMMMMMHMIMMMTKGQKMTGLFKGQIESLIVTKKDDIIKVDIGDVSLNKTTNVQVLNIQIPA